MLIGGLEAAGATGGTEKGWMPDCSASASGGSSCRDETRPIFHWLPELGSRRMSVKVKGDPAKEPRRLCFSGDGERRGSCAVAWSLNWSIAAGRSCRAGPLGGTGERSTSGVSGVGGVTSVMGRGPTGLRAGIDVWRRGGGNMPF